MEIETHLVLSTAHIAVTTAELLDRWASMQPGSRPHSVATTDYGWFVSTYLLEHVATPTPTELTAILEFARGQGCAWVLLDRDGDTLAELPTFDW